MSIVDVYDALTSRRAYRDALPYEQSMAILGQETEAEKFDPLLFVEFRRLVESRPDFQVCRSE
jgi:HD-GYP domain-containing protein (c-di-GMP phosphodiesterase class II)